MKDSQELNYSPAFVYRKRDIFAIHFYWRANPFLPMMRYRPTFNLNRIQDLTTRIRAAEVMAETVTEALKAGWNPITNEYPGGLEMAAPDTIKFYLPETLKAAHRSILSKSKKDRTHSSYNSHLKLLTEYLQEKKRYEIAPDQFTRLDAQSYLDNLITGGYAPKTVNTKFDYASGLFDWMHKTGILKENPFASISRVDEPDEEDEDALFTDKEIARIRKHLYTDGVYPELWHYFLFIYYCYMRPDSIMAIKGEDLDISARKLKVWPDNHKNSKKAVKQLLLPHVDYLTPYLAEIDLKPHEYLFSRHMKPGPVKWAPTRPAELWNLHVKKALGIKKNAYIGKHTGGTQYLEDNDGTENLKWLQQQMSHANLQTTALYVAKKKRKVVLDESKAKIKSI